MQVIIMESVEALAIQIERELIKHSCDAPVVDSILSCLHPIEVPSEVEKLVGKIIMLFAEAQIKQTDEAITQALAEAAALITAYSRTVPRCYEEKNRCNDCPADYPDKECPSYPEAQGNCEWEESEEAGAWEGSCGIFWTFPNDVSPEENGVAFCPMCGRRVKITRLGYRAE